MSAAKKLKVPIKILSKPFMAAALHFFAPILFKYCTFGRFSKDFTTGAIFQPKFEQPCPKTLPSIQY
jgi:hypothetical protein